MSVSLKRREGRVVNECRFGCCTDVYGKNVARVRRAVRRRSNAKARSEIDQALQDMADDLQEVLDADAAWTHLYDEVEDPWWPMPPEDVDEYLYGPEPEAYPWDRRDYETFDDYDDPFEGTARAREREDYL